MNGMDALYGTPMEMKEDIYKGSLVIILEMNNDVNKIMGLGVVKNSIATDKYYKIYKWGNYSADIHTKVNIE